jgi:hypothetical protein
LTSGHALVKTRAHARDDPPGPCYVNAAPLAGRARPLPRYRQPHCGQHGRLSSAAVTLGQVLHLLGEDPHQRANLVAESGADDTKTVDDEVGPDGQPQEFITGPDA